MPAMTKLMTNSDKTMLFQLCVSPYSKSFDLKHHSCYIHTLPYTLSEPAHSPRPSLWSPAPAAFRRVEAATSRHHRLHLHDLPPHAFHRPSEEPMPWRCSSGSATLALALGRRVGDNTPLLYWWLLLYAFRTAGEETARRSRVYCIVDRGGEAYDCSAPVGRDWRNVQTSPRRGQAAGLGICEERQKIDYKYK